MLRRSTIARVIALGLLPALLVTGAVPAWSLFFCDMERTAISSRCCDDAVEQDDTDHATTTIASAECCRKIGGELERARYVPLTGFHLAALPALLSTDVLAPLLAATRLVAADVDTQDATGPPIRLRTQTFLI